MLFAIRDFAEENAVVGVMNWNRQVKSKESFLRSLKKMVENTFTDACRLFRWKLVISKLQVLLRNCLWIVDAEFK